MRENHMPAHHRSTPRAVHRAEINPSVNDETLKAESIRVERKSFIFTLKENRRGRFLRITEDVSGRRDTIIVPAPGLQDFRRVVDEMAKLSAETPEKPVEDEAVDP